MILIKCLSDVQNVNVRFNKNLHLMLLAMKLLSTLFGLQPCHYISHLLGHEGKGSLLSELKTKGKFSNDGRFFHPKIKEMVHLFWEKHSTYWSNTKVSLLKQL